MEKTLFRFAVMITMALGLYLPPAAQVASAHAASTVSDPGSTAQAMISPSGFLNPDGTLKLDGSVPGSLDLKGWNVSLDPGRGPVFSPAKSGEAAPLASGSPGNWSDMGGGGGGAVNGEVLAVAVSGSNVYVGGWFTVLANISAAGYIAKWNGSSWSALGSNGSGYSSLNSAVLAIAVSGSNVYVGGYFTDVNNGGTVLNAADYVAKWDGSNWSALGSNGAGNGSLNSFVYALAVDGSGNVYVGGIFANVNNGGVVLNAADNVAKWDGSNWSALGSNGAGNGSLNSDVLAIAVSGSNVYVGGIFIDVNNNGTVLSAADYVAKWDGSNWSALGHGTLTTDGSLNGSVRALAVDGSGNAYVGGNFINVNNGGVVLNAADYVAKWNGSNWSALGHGTLTTDGSLNGNVIAIAVSGTNVYVGGYFTNVNNGGTVLNAADYVAKWDGSNWSALRSNGAGDGSLNDGVLAIAVGGTNVYAGGDFYNVNNNGTALGAADYVSKWDTTNWSAMGAVQGSLNNTVFAMAVSGTNVYVGGKFTHVVNHGTTLSAADYIAKWDGTNWSALGHGTSTTDGSLNGAVYAIAVSGTNVYVGGWFTDVNNSSTVLTSADYVAKWDGSNWSALGHGTSTTDGSLNSGVSSIAVSGTNVYVGGDFTDVNNGGTVLNAADYVAKWNGSNWSALGHATSTNEGSLPSYVYALAVDGSGNVYVGGSFNEVNNNGTVLYAAAYVAKWDGGNWSALGSNGAGSGSLNFYVNALAVSGTSVYVGGSFSNVNNGGTPLHAANNVAKWDGSNWSALGSNGAGGASLNGSVDAIAVYGSNVYVGGNFTDVNNNGTLLGAADRVAEWNGTNWSALGSNGAGDGSINAPNSANVYALAVNSADLYVGGYFYNVNNNGSLLPYADYAADYTAMVALASPWYGSASITSDRNVVAVGRPHVGAEVASYDGFASGSLTSYLPMLFKNAFGGTYDSAFYVQDVDPANTAHVSIDYYDTSGAHTCGPIADTVSQLSSKGYWVPSECPPVGWVGGVVVTSDHAIVTVGRPHVGAEVMTYDGFSSGSLTSYLPMLFKNMWGYDSAFYIQNVDPTHTANVTVKYYDTSGVLSCTKDPDTIAPFATHGIWVPSETCLPASWYGGVVITSDWPIVAVGRPHIGSQVTTYDGFTAGSTSSFVPMLFKNGFGASYDSALYVQNVDPSADAHVTIRYYDSAGTLTYTRPLDTIPPLSSLGIWVPSEPLLPDGWVGGAVITSSDYPIVAVGRPHVGAQVTTYDGFTAGTTSMSLPMLFKNMWGSYDSAFYVQNTYPGGTASVTIKFYDVDGNLSCTRSDSIPALATQGYWVPSVTCSP